jgi:transposase
MNATIILIQEFSKRWKVLWLKSKNLSHELICDIANITPNTMRAYIKDFEKGGIDKLKDVNFYRPASELKKHSKTIEEYFWEHPPRTASEASVKIAELTGIKRSLTQTRIFLKNIGMSLRKVGPIPGKALSETKKKNKKNLKKKN